MLKRLLFNLIIALPAIGLLPVFSSAQASPNTQAAIKFDEFGDIQYSDLIARLDNFAIQLQQQPGTRGFIIIYRTRRDLPGMSSRLGSRMKNYLINSRRVPSQLVVTVDGGIASNLAQELWIVPVGSTPKPRNDVYIGQLMDIASAWKFDEYYYPLPQDPNEYDNDPNSLESFAEALRTYSKSQAYILAYPQYYRRSVHPDPPNTALKMLRAVKDELISEYKIAPSRIKLVNGGYRKVRQVELWIVPQGEHPPIATPNAFPRRRR
jgi:hypothetical protein